MDFRDLAAKETNALTARLFPAAADSTRQRLKAFRSAIEGAAKALEAALTTPPQFDREINEFVARLIDAAAKDTETAVGRVTDEARAAAERLQAQIKAATDEKTALEVSLTAAEARATALDRDVEEHKGQLQAVRGELAQAKDAWTAVEQARAEAVAAGEAQAAARATAEREVQVVRTMLDTVRAELSGTTTELETAVAEKAGLEETLRAVESQARDAEARLAAADASLNDAAARIAALEQEARDHAARVGVLEAEARESAARAGELEAKARESAARVSVLEAEARESATRVSALQSVNTESAVRVATLEAENREGAARAELLEAEGREHAARLRELMAAGEERTSRVLALEAAEKEHQLALHDLQTMLDASAAVVAERDRRAVSLFDELLEGFRALAAAPTINAVLTAMVPRLSVAFSRVALFKVHGNRLEGEHQAGFDPKTDINKVAIPVGMDSLLSRAASSGRTERLSGPELAESGLVPFKGTPTFALAVPVALHGETLAILYADDSGHAAADSATYEMRTRFADALVQHGTSVLMRLTAELKALAELRDYAKSLLTEIEEMFLADAGADKPEDELHNRLKGHLEYARSIFATRVAMEGPGAATLLEDELSTIVETKGSSPFGRALSVVSGIAAPGARAAEAS